MNKIDWRDEYCLGNDEIDFEHRIFVKIIVKIDKAIQNGKDLNTIKRLLLELEKYTLFHFQSEENVMVDLEYPDILNHKAKHETLLSQLQLLLLKIEIGDTELHELPHFLISWFKEHTLTEDRKLVAYL